eukprot:2457125-Amphidinium_carterae.1
MLGFEATRSRSTTRRKPQNGLPNRLLGNLQSRCWGHRPKRREAPWLRTPLRRMLVLHFQENLRRHICHRPIYQRSTGLLEQHTVLEQRLCPSHPLLHGRWSTWATRLPVPLPSRRPPKRMALISFKPSPAFSALLLFCCPNLGGGANNTALGSMQNSVQASSHEGHSLGSSRRATPDASPTGELRIKAGLHRGQARGQAGEYLVAMSLLHT